jgi:hypothetical protein
MTVLVRIPAAETPGELAAVGAGGAIRLIPAVGDGRRWGRRRAEGRACRAHTTRGRGEAWG